MAVKLREIPDKAVELVKQFEGLSLTVYKDVAGYPTIGYGHLILEGEDFSEGITEEIAEELLREELKTAGLAVGKLITVPLTDNQYSALISWTFNLGQGALRSSTLRKVLNEGQYDKVPDEMRRWVYAGGKKVQGLVNRREREAALFEET